MFYGWSVQYKKRVLLYVSGGDKTNPRLRQLTPRDRKRKADTPEEQDSSQSSPASRARKRTRSEESKPHSPAKPQSKRDLTPSPASSVSESTPPLRVSPRNTPSKERVLKPTRTSTPTLRTSNHKPIHKPQTPKAEVQRTATPKLEVQRTPTPKQEVHKPQTPKSEVRKPLTPKTDVRRTPTPKPETQKPTVQAKERVSISDKVKTEDSKANANVKNSEVNTSANSADLSKQKPKTRPKRETKDSSADSPRTSSVVKTQEQATPVIKPLSGSQKDKTEKNTSAKSDKVTEKSGSKLNEPTGSSNVKPGKYNKNRTTSSSSDNINDQVEEKLKEIRTALCEKEKEKELERSKALAAKGKTQTSEGSTDRKKSDRSVTDKKEKAAERKTRKNERKKEKGKFNVDTEAQGDAVAEKPPNKPSKERDKTEIADDNMHYIKKKQLSQGGFIAGPQNSGIASSNIDVNQSVTDQVARAEKLSSLHCEEKTGSTSSTLSSPNSDTNIDRSESRDIQLPSTQPRDNKVAPNSLNTVNNNNTNTNSSWSHEERSHSRASEERCSSGLSDVGEIRRPSSQADDLKSSKSSAASSPLIVDKSEPVLPYRDPELMSKNPVRSNVPNMHNSQNSYRSERTVHNPVPTAASRPASTGMSSAPITLSSSLSSSRTPVIPSVAYPSPLGLGHALPGNSLSSLLPPGLHQLDPATLAIHQQMAAVHQQQLTAALAQTQFQNALSLSYPVTLSSTQLEHLWQQKYPSVPVPPPWLLAKHQDDLLRDRILREHEQLERERLDRIERDRERDRAERDRVERERKERDRRLEQERLEKERRERWVLNFFRAFSRSCVLLTIIFQLNNGNNTWATFD